MIVTSKDRIGQVPIQASKQTDLEASVVLMGNQANPNDPSPNSSCRSIIGYVLIIFGAFLMCLATVLMKLTHTFNAFDQLFIRYIIHFLITFAICRIKGLNCMGKKSLRKLLLIRALFSLVAVFVTYLALTLIDPSDFTIINNSSVIITLVFCRLLLKEKITITHILAIIFTAMGVVCIFRPKFLFSPGEFLRHDGQSNASNQTSDNGHSRIGIQQSIGVLLSIVVACAMGLNSVFLKKLSTEKVHYAVANIYPSYFGILISFCISLTLILTGYSHANFFVDEKQFFWLHLLYTTISGTSGNIGFLLLIKSFDYEDAARLTIVKTIDVLFAFLLQLFILNISFDSLGIIGAACILTSVLIVICLKLFETSLEKKKCLKIFVLKF
jgi:drug/metabolite transporter (DMT)-like permease